MAEKGGEELLEGAKQKGSVLQVEPMHLHWSRRSNGTEQHSSEDAYLPRGESSTARYSLTAIFQLCGDSNLSDAPRQYWILAREM